MKPKKDGYGFVVTLLLLGWLIGSPAEVDPVPADDTVSVVPAPPDDEKGGDLGSPAHDEPVRVTDDPSSFVHTIHVRNGNTGGQGSATHIRGGVYLTCRHVFDRSVSSVEVDGVPASGWSIASGPDFAVVRTKASSAAAALVNTSPLSDGQSLRVVGQKTGLHAGELSPKRWSHGYRAVVCAVPTESGDSGAGVFNDAGELVGVHWGSSGNEVFFTPLSEVSSMIQPTPGSVAADAPVAAAEPFCDCDPCTCANCACGAVSASKPSITIHVADFNCPPCDVLKGYDWQDFDVQWVTGGADAYPTIAWHDKDGVRRVLRGAYSPWRVRWSYDRTMQ